MYDSRLIKLPNFLFIYFYLIYSLFAPVLHKMWSSKFIKGNAKTTITPLSLSISQTHEYGQKSKTNLKN